MRRRAVIRRYGKDQRGATAIEYGLIVGIIATLLLSIAATGGAVTALYDRMADIAGALLGGDEEGD